MSEVTLPYRVEIMHCKPGCLIKDSHLGSRAIIEHLVEQCWDALLDKYGEDALLDGRNISVEIASYGALEATP